MGIRWLDVLETVAPIGVAMIPGVGIPAAIAMSAAMKGGSTALKGGDMTEVLRDAAIGGATGAAGVGTAGAISKFAGKAGEAAVGAGGKAATKAFEKTADVGFGKAAEQAMGALSKAGTAQKVAQGVAGATSGALGKDPEKTAAMLKTLKSGGQAVGAVDDIAQMAYQPPRFSQQHAAMARQAGMNPKYQFGVQGPDDDPRQSLGFGRFY